MQTTRTAMFRNALRSPALSALITVLVLIVATLTLRYAGVLEPLELAAYDRMVGLRGADDGGPSRLLQITANEDDIKRFNWPLPDGVLAEIIARLDAAGPSAIGMDIFRPTPIGAGSDTLDATLARVPEVVWADRFGGVMWDQLAAPAAAARRAGFADSVVDPAGVTRRALLYLSDDATGRQEMSFSLGLASFYLRKHGVSAHFDADGTPVLGTTRLSLLTGPTGGYASRDEGGDQILIEYRAPVHIATYSVSDLIDGRVPAAAITDKIVVVGMVSDSVKDFVIAPVSPEGPAQLPGVTLQGLIAAQLVAHGLDGLPSTHALPRLADNALLALVMLAAGLFGVAVRSSALLAIATIGGAAALVWLSYVAFLHALWLPVLLLPAGWVLAIVLSKTAMAQVEATQRAFLMRLFSTHMSAPIAREMWERRHDFVRFGRPLPVRLQATVLFSDVNDFTTISEQMEPEQIVAWLEPYMITMTNLIDEHGGCVERFSGDGILAMFGVPVRRTTREEIEADAIAAVECARRMGEAIERLNADYRAAGQPEIRFAVGIQSGVLVGCSLGSDDRQQYTTMGDTTNTAARLVNVAKDVMKRPGVAMSACTVIGAATRALVGARFPLRPLGAIDLKGKARRTECFAIEAPGLPEETFASAAKYGSVA